MVFSISTVALRSSFWSISMNLLMFSLRRSAERSCSSSCPLSAAAISVRLFWAALISFSVSLLISAPVTAASAVNWVCFFSLARSSLTPKRPSRRVCKMVPAVASAAASFSSFSVASAAWAWSSCCFSSAAASSAFAFATSFAAFAALASAACCCTVAFRSRAALAASFCSTWIFSNSVASWPRVVSPSCVTAWRVCACWSRTVSFTDSTALWMVAAHCARRSSSHCPPDRGRGVSRGELASRPRCFRAFSTTLRETPMSFAILLTPMVWSSRRSSRTF
mmetsp:Transcript_19847/g.50178  ORF Transcript_19847/g.50178 Transcript_19847/m.50178 type:complete len:279 (-) Transcript_19847:379-1215(-)